MSKDPRCVWIDLENTPHVPFFAPFIEEFERRGVKTLVTARPRAQTVELAEYYGLDFSIVGPGRPHRQKWKKAIGILRRVWNLSRFDFPQKPFLALSHGSRSQVAAARFLGIPAVTFLDYEHVSLRLLKLFADRIYFPEILKGKLKKDSFYYYAALKEDLYISEELKEVQCDSGCEKIHIVFRPPARYAHYHGEAGFDVRVGFKKIFEQSARQMVVDFYPRVDSDLDYWADCFAADNIELEIAGSKLCRAGEWLGRADLVIGGGGSMTREAAVAGLPAYSFFQGEPGAADSLLEEEGRLVMLRDEKDLEKIEFKKVTDFNFKERSITISDLIDNFLDGYCC